MTKTINEIYKVRINYKEKHKIREFYTSTFPSTAPLECSVYYSNCADQKDEDMINSILVNFNEVLDIEIRELGEENG